MKSINFRSEKNHKVEKNLKMVPKMIFKFCLGCFEGSINGDILENP